MEDIALRYHISPLEVPKMDATILMHMALVAIGREALSGE